MSEQKLICGMPDEWFSAPLNYRLDAAKDNGETNWDIHLHEYPNEGRFIVKRIGWVAGILERTGDCRRNLCTIRLKHDCGFELGVPEARAIAFRLRDYDFNRKMADADAEQGLLRQRRINELREASKRGELAIVAHQEIIDLLTKMSEALVEQNKKLDVLARSTHDIPRRMKNNEY